VGEEDVFVFFSVKTLSYDSVRRCFCTFWGLGTACGVYSTCGNSTPVDNELIYGIEEFKLESYG
jgi:hypothetical protein